MTFFCRAIRARQFLILAIFAEFFLAFSLQAQLATGGKVSAGFKIPVVENGEVKTLFEGEEIKPQGKGQVLVTKFRMTTYRAKREEDLIAEAPECFFDQSTYTAWSPGQLKLRKVDGRFALEGVGFEWRQASSRLVVSNSVHTTLRRDLTNAPAAAAQANSPAQTRQELEVVAEHFEFDSKLGQAIYKGSVRANDAERLKLNCEILTVKLPAGGNKFENILAERDVVIVAVEEGVDYRATSDRAVYTTATNGVEAIELTGNSTWQTKQFEGRGDVLFLNSNKKQLQFKARGNASVKLPASSMGRADLLSPKPAVLTNAPTGTNRWVEIFSDEYDYQTGLAIFRGQVRVNNEPDWKLVSEILTIKSLPDTNRIDNIVAERNVVIDVKDKANEGRATADKAVLTGSDGSLELTGNPAWHTKEFDGKGDILTLISGKKDPDFMAKGNASVRLPRTAVGQFISFLPGTSVPTNSLTATNRFLDIFADEFQFKSQTAVFQGHVRAQNPPGQLTCGLLTARFSPARDQIESLVAEQNAVFEQVGSHLAAGRMTAQFTGPTNRLERFVADENVELVTGKGESLLTGACEKMIYTTSDGLMKFIGNPVAKLPRNILMKGAEVITWDLANNKFRANDYKITGTRESLKQPGELTPKP